MSHAGQQPSKIAGADFALVRAAFIAKAVSETEHRPLTELEEHAVKEGIRVLEATLLEYQRKRNTQSILNELEALQPQLEALQAAAPSTQRGFSQFPALGACLQPSGPVRPEGGA